VGFDRLLYGTLQVQRKERNMELFLMATASVLAMLFVFWMILSKDDFLGDEIRKSPLDGDK
jgi:hypothetical protein